MVAPSGPCAGAQVVYQEDNAEPHTEQGYTLWIREQFELLGWKLELQATRYSYNSDYYYYILYYLTMYFFYYYLQRSVYKRLGSIFIPIHVTQTFCPATDVQQYRSYY